MLGETTTMTDEGDVIFDGSEDVEDWEPVEDQDSSQVPDYYEYDIEFVNASECEEGDYWVGEYVGTEEIGESDNATCQFVKRDEETTFAFPNHAMLRSQLTGTELSENQSRADNPVEEGESVAVVYGGTQEIEGRPMDMHVWQLKRPPK